MLRDSHTESITMNNLKFFHPHRSFYSFTWMAFVFILAYACDKSNITPEEQLTGEQAESASLQKTSQDLYRVTSEQQKANNFVISPLSIQLALYMVYNGAEGETREEIGDLLRVMDADLETLNQRVKILIDYLSGLVEEGHLDVHNALFYDENRVEIAEQFVQRLTQYFELHHADLNFDEPAAVASINQWVQDKTYDKIQEVLQDISDQEVLFLLNALYLKADWVTGFLEEATAERPFTTMDGTEIMIPTMHQTMSVQHLTRDGAVVTRLPLADSSLYAYLIMPNNPNDLENMIQSDIVNAIWENSLDFDHSRVRFEMPIVETKTHVTLNNALQSLGMVTAFDPQNADLTLMGQAKNGLPLFVSRTLHDVYLKMDEKGVEGAAVTTIGVGTTSLPPALQLNKPFLYLIVDQQFGLPLFIGQFTGVEGKS